MRVVVCLVFAVSIAYAAVAGAAPRTLTWTDLVPPAPAFQNAFLDLDRGVQDDVAQVYRWREDLNYGYIVEGDEEHAELKALERQLTSAGHDIEALIASAEAADAEYRRREKLTDPTLDGQSVRIAGYALPLEFADAGVSEFLLVPYVGACIHAPAPPLNQTVLAKLQQNYRMTGLYDPVWVTGVLHVEGGSRALSFMDGQADIAVGYRLNVTRIEPYE